MRVPVSTGGCSWQILRPVIHGTWCVMSCGSRWAVCQLGPSSLLGTAGCCGSVGTVESWTLLCCPSPTTHSVRTPSFSLPSTSAVRWSCSWIDSVLPSTDSGAASPPQTWSGLSSSRGRCAGAIALSSVSTTGCIGHGSLGALHLSADCTWSGTASGYLVLPCSRITDTSRLVLRSPCCCACRRIYGCTLLCGRPCRWLESRSGNKNFRGSGTGGWWWHSGRWCSCLRWRSSFSGTRSGHRRCGCRNGSVGLANWVFGSPSLGSSLGPSGFPALSSGSRNSSRFRSGSPGTLTVSCPPAPTPSSGFPVRTPSSLSFPRYAWRNLSDSSPVASSLGTGCSM